MNKILSGLLLAGLLGITAQADFVRVEMGAGMWNQKVSGDIQYKGESAITTDTLNYGSESKPYVWAFIKHPVPVVPNLRLEYSPVEFTGTTTQTFTYNGKTFTGSTKSTLTMDQLDAVLYYNILDNTFWITADLGLDIKSMSGKFKADSTPSGIAINESQNLVLPLAYLRGRVVIPGTGLGVEAEGKYLGYQNSKLMDASIKVDYTLVDMIPFVNLGVEAGYRAQTINLDAADIGSVDTSLTLDVKGVFFGIVGRF